MTPELEHSFSITIQVDKPVIVSRSPQSETSADPNPQRNRTR
jgi:hypothetical protein